MATKLFIIPNERFESGDIKESDGTIYLCPTGSVMTGRWHSGDENGNTKYQYATLKAVDETGQQQNVTIEVTDIQWSDEIQESSGTLFQAPADRVIVGRQHTGDENGMTRYATAVVLVDGVAASTIAVQTSGAIIESSGEWFMAGPERVIVGRQHYDDENGITYYYTAKLLIDNTVYEPAPVGTTIVPAAWSETGVYNESNSDFLCPENTVMVGRIHEGNENGDTRYQYATLKAINAKGETIPGYITVDDVVWHPRISESDGLGFDAPAHRVIVGRRHWGDENGWTQYATAAVRFNGYPTFILKRTVSEPMLEHVSEFTCDSKQVITGRHHYGDEESYTYYNVGTIFCHRSASQLTFPFDLVVSLYDGEENYPMSASDYIVLSRFRKHVHHGTDMGYDKDLNEFVSGDRHAPEFYNIPLSTLKTYYSKLEHYRLFNLRPRDPMCAPGDEMFFLQPFANLHGNFDPNGQVPVYVNVLEYNLENGSKAKYVDFWLFFGYNEAPKIVVFFHYSHQGDWEHIMVELIDDKVTGVWLSAHGPSTYYKASDLKIDMVNGKPQITVYCAKGSHALYNRDGEFKIPTSGATDRTSVLGYKWRITDCVERLGTQQWRQYAGAWGEIGESKDSTGPLGAWYKRFNYWYVPSISLLDILESDDLIIAPDQLYISAEHSESDSFIFEAPEGMVMVGRRHMGDEDGPTVCLYATLKAINAYLFPQEGDIQVVDSHWCDEINEYDSDFRAPNGYVILGRQHTGGKNGNTRYKVGKILFNGVETTVESTDSLFEYQYYRENVGVFFQTTPYYLFTGRNHQGDDEGYTYNMMGMVRVNK